MWKNVEKSGGFGGFLGGFLSRIFFERVGIFISSLTLCGHFWFEILNIQIEFLDLSRYSKIVKIVYKKRASELSEVCFLKLRNDHSHVLSQASG